MDFIIMVEVIYRLSLTLYLTSDKENF